jgi:hypothetical protein
MNIKDLKCKTKTKERFSSSLMIYWLVLQMNPEKNLIHLLSRVEEEVGLKR